MTDDFSDQPLDPSWTARNGSPTMAFSMSRRHGLRAALTMLRVVLSAYWHRDPSVTLEIGSD